MTRPCWIIESSDGRIDGYIGLYDGKGQERSLDDVLKIVAPRKADLLEWVKSGDKLRLGDYEEYAQGPAMSAYRVTMLDCDLCGEVYDPGPNGVAASFAVVRRMASREETDWRYEGETWRSWRSVDICPKHSELSIPQALNQVEARFNGFAINPTEPELGK